MEYSEIFPRVRQKHRFLNATFNINLMPDLICSYKFDHPMIPVMEAKVQKHVTQTGYRLM